MNRYEKTEVIKELTKYIDDIEIRRTWRKVNEIVIEVEYKIILRKGEDE